MLPQKLPIGLMQTQWAAQINPILSNELLQGHLISGQALIDGATTFNHKLGRKMIGWFLTDVNGAATIYRSQPLNAQTLTLTSDAAVTANIWVF